VPSATFRAGCPCSAGGDHAYLSSRSKLRSDENPPRGTDLQEWLAEAYRLSEEGDWEEVFRVLRDAEGEHPRDAGLLCMLGVAAEHADVGGLAYEYFRRSLTEQPTDPVILVQLGAGLARYDDPDAEGVLRLAALSAPQMGDARLEYGAFLAREGIVDTALEELAAARTLLPDDPRVGREMAVALLLAGRAGEGADELERSLANDPDEGDLLLLHGLALFQAQRPEEGAEVLFRAGEALTEDGEAQLLAALACASQEWWDQAWDALARADLAQRQPSSEVTQEVEDALEGGADEARVLLEEQIGPSVLRERLLERI
jgi:Flp pilus assembly protein TadD